MAEIDVYANIKSSKAARKNDQATGRPPAQPRPAHNSESGAVCRGQRKRKHGKGRTSSRRCACLALGVTVCISVVMVSAMAVLLWRKSTERDCGLEEVHLEMCRNETERYSREAQTYRLEAEKFRKKLESVFCVDPFNNERKQQCCPEGWKGGDSGRCYYISTDQRSWEFASHFCSSVGAQLLETEDKRELNFLGSLLEGYFYWIGLRKDSSSEWRWVNGTELNKDLITVKTGYSDGDCACGYWSGDVFTAYSRKCEETFSWICVGDPV
nr:PREDICTED: C-type lectin domain family 10 member A-like [Lepisosteus oculatus]XP_015193462.1 PREDICTED: C-type lectin domain family 10 member A-like [Lepisosteus oculatus]